MSNIFRDIVHGVNFKRKQIFVILLALLASMWFLNKAWLTFSRNPGDKIEAFNQTGSFVLKNDRACYDEFYLSMINDVNGSTNQTNYIINAIMEAGKFGESDQDKLLDIDCEGGDRVFAFVNRGLSAYGTDSQHAVDFCRKKWDTYVKSETTPPRSIPHFVVGDDVDFYGRLESNSFSHVSLIGYKIYELRDKNSFFESCRRILKPRGILILQLVDAENFIGFKPPKMQENEMLQNVDLLDEDIESTGDAFLETDTFTYTSKNTFSGSQIEWKETYKDKINGNVRQQVRSITIDTEFKILELAKTNGFKIHAKIDLKPVGANNEYLYIFQNSY